MATKSAGLQDGSYWAVIAVGSAAVLTMAFLAVRAETPLQGVNITMTGNVTLLLITGGSVAIERILEAVWTVLDMLQGRSVALAPQATRLNALVTGVNGSLSKALVKLEDDVKKYQAAVPAAEQRVGDVLGSVARIRSNLKMAAGSMDSGAISNSLGRINRSIDEIITKYPVLTDKTTIDETLDESLMAAQSLQELLATFESNPGRQLLSIVWGAFLGLGVAFLLGLNVFTAIGPDGQAAAAAVPPTPSIWIAITGFVMGLGSTPTHELIKAVQQQKQKQPKAT